MGHDKNESVPDQAWASRKHRALVNWAKLDSLLEEKGWDEMQVTDIRIQGPAITGGGLRLIVKGTLEGRKFVAFQNATTAEELVAGLHQRIESNSLKWRDDVPWDGLKVQGPARPNELS